MNGTRGGAAAIVHFDGQRQTLDFAGIRQYRRQPDR